jgi:hypothetical protein
MGEEIKRNRIVCVLLVCIYEKGKNQPPYAPERESRSLPRWRNYVVYLKRIYTY